ncbi:hypothetical protein BC834DRAFT_844426 [Gloeopeniophorella convolvens]|nr:hypothetical protein BC834DRAFT_844426 [Gloeopeniophorella convolvens]
MAKDNAISGDFLLVTKQMKNVGRAYKKQSTEFIKLCRAVDAHPRSHDRDGGFHEIMELVDDALQKIALAGKNPTPAADAALETAKEKMKVYMEGVGIDTAALEGLNRAQAADKSSAGKFAKLKEKMGVAPGTGLRRGSTKKLNFHLLNSPHERDQTVFIVHRLYFALSAYDPC